MVSYFEKHSGSPAPDPPRPPVARRQVRVVEQEQLGELSGLRGRILVEIPILFVRRVVAVQLDGDGQIAHRVGEVAVIGELVDAVLQGRLGFEGIHAGRLSERRRCPL